MAARAPQGWVLLLIAAAVSPSPALAFQARINRPLVHEVIGRGQAVRGAIEVENEGDAPVALEVYLQDWEYLEGGTGEKRFSSPGESPWSASGWITYAPARLELAGRGKGVVEYVIRVPPDVSGGRYAVLFFESVLARTPQDANGVSVQYTGRLGALFDLEVTGTVERTGEIRELAIGRPDEDRPLALGYTFLNTGNVAIRPKAYFNIVDRIGRYVGRGELPQLYTFPGRSGSATAEWTGALSPGDYTVLLTVDLDGAQVLVHEEPLRVAREVVIEAVTLSREEPLTAEVRVHNAGHVGTAVEGTLALETESGAVAGRWPIPRTALSPDERAGLTVAASGASAAGVARCHVTLAADGVAVERTLPCRRE